MDIYAKACLRLMIIVVLTAILISGICIYLFVHSEMNQTHKILIGGCSSLLGGIIGGIIAISTMKT